MKILTSHGSQPLELMQLTVIAHKSVLVVAINNSILKFGMWIKF